MREANALPKMRGCPAPRTSHASHHDDTGHARVGGDGANSASTLMATRLVAELDDLGRSFPRNRKKSERSYERL